MEVKINLDFDQILSLVHQLPDRDIEKLAGTLQSELASKKAAESLEELISQAPTWLDSELKDFQEARGHSQPRLP